MWLEIAVRVATAPEQRSVRGALASALAPPPARPERMAAAMPDLYWRPPSRVDATALSSCANVPVSRRR
jgi:hypothetical protein